MIDPFLVVSYGTNKEFTDLVSHEDLYVVSNTYNVLLQQRQDKEDNASEYYRQSAFSITI